MVIPRIVLEELVSLVILLYTSVAIRLVILLQNIHTDRDLLAIIDLRLILLVKLLLMPLSLMRYISPLSQ